MRYQKNHLSLQTRHQKIYISWVIDKSWLMQESPGLKPSWFEEIKLFSIKNLNISLNISFSSISRQIGSNETGQKFFKHCLSPFLWTMNVYERKRTSINALMKDKLQKFKKDLSQIFIMWILILWQPWTLFGYKFCIIFSLSLLERFIVSKRLSVV